MKTERFCIWATSLLFLSGCFWEKKPEAEASRFRDIYRQLEDRASIREEEERSFARLTLSASNMPLRSFLRWVTDKTAVSIICDKDLDEAPITVDVVDTPLPDILAAVARRLSVDLTQQGNLYYMGALKPEDRGVLVRKVRRLGADDLQKTVEVLLSEMGRAAAYSDGVLVVGDRVRVLQRIHSMLDQVEGADSNTWIIQLYLISTQDTFTRDIGMDTDVALDVAATFATHSGTDAPSASGALSAMLQAARTTGSAEVVAEPLMLLVDGGTASFRDGESIPIAEKTVSENGAVTTSGFQFVETGIISECTIREVSPETAKCSLNINLTNVTGYVENAPIVTGQKFGTTAVLKSGGVYLLGSMTRKHNQRDTKGSFFPTLFSKSKTSGHIQIWLRCFRIAGPLTERRFTHADGK